MQFFFLALSLNPDVQKKAQAELDAVIGHDRLPTLADRERLPYVNALCSEVLRWQNVAPTGECYIYFYDKNKSNHHTINRLSPRLYGR